MFLKYVEMAFLKAIFFTLDFVTLISRELI
jgi:hypothetical protein